MRPFLVALVVSSACSAPPSQDGGTAGGASVGGGVATGGGTATGGGSGAGGGTGGGSAAGGGSGGGGAGGGGVGGGVVDAGLPATALPFDVVVVGAGTGGTAAALQAARLGAKVALVEPTWWVGGQATAAAVTAMDEGHPYVRDSGIYGEWMARVTARYADAGKSVGTCHWNAGSHSSEPRVAELILRQMVAATDGGVTLMLGTAVTSVYRSGNAVMGVGLNDGGALASRVLIDATEYGDVLPLAGARYRVGNATSDAPDSGACIQDFTWVAVLKKYPAGVPAGLAIPVGQKPPGYDLQRPAFEAVVSLDGGSLYVGGLVYPVDFASHNAYRGMPDSTAPGTQTAGSAAGAAALTRTGINWANDYPDDAPYVPSDGGPRHQLSIRYLEEPGFRAQEACAGKLRTLQFIYYVQHGLNQPLWSIADDEGYAAHFDDGGCPNIPPEFKAIEQHFPPIPYVRESRRIFGRYTLTAADLIGRESTDGGTPRLFPSAIALGTYADDLHNCRADQTLEAPETRADITNGGLFQIPFEVLIPETVEGLIAAEKNLSQTRLASGATRLQPETMMTGQAAGTIAALAVRRNVRPSQVPVIVVQDALVRSNQWLSWYQYSDVPWGDPRWGDVQIVSTRGVLVGFGGGVFGVGATLTRAQAAVMLARLFALDVSNPPTTPSFTDVPTTHFAYAQIEALKAAGYTSGCGGGLFCPDGPLLRSQLAVFTAKGLGLDLNGVPMTQRFTDVPTSHLAFRQIQAVTDAGVMGPCSAGLFCPDQAVTRGEAAGVSRAVLLYGQ